MEFNKTEKENPEVRVTPEMMKNFPTIECDCGGKIFHSALVFKKISQFVSPSGKEELYPIEVLICEECGKVPTQFNLHEMLPEDILAKKPEKKEEKK